MSIDRPKQPEMPEPSEQDAEQCRIQELGNFLHSLEARAQLSAEQNPYEVAAGAVREFAALYTTIQDAVADEGTSHLRDGRGLIEHSKTAGDKNNCVGVSDHSGGILKLEGPEGEEIDWIANANLLSTSDRGLVHASYQLAVTSDSLLCYVRGATRTTLRGRRHYFDYWASGEEAAELTEIIQQWYNLDWKLF